VQGSIVQVMAVEEILSQEGIHLQITQCDYTAVDGITPAPLLARPPALL